MSELADAAAPRIKHAATAIIVLAVLALLYSLYFARSFLVPIAFAIMLDFILSPVVRLLGKARLPTAGGAAIVVLGVLAIFAVGAYQLAGPVQKFLTDAPASAGKARAEIAKIMRPLQQVSENAEKVATVTGVPADSGQQPAKVVVVGPTFASRIAGTTQLLLAGFTETMLLLFFLLAGGDLFLEKTIRLLPLMQDKKKAVRIARDIESAVSVYLIANLGINMVEGVMVGVALYFIGLPNPLLWAVLTVALEFIPFIGAIIMIGLLTVSALSTFDSIGHVLLAPAAFLLANFIQGNIVSNIVLGRRLALNTVALFVGLAFWFWIWGIPGAFIGVPLMSMIKICCDHIEALAPLGEFLGARDEPTRAASLPGTVAA
jgi:predicted PurR-regulated permease PerM